MIDSYEKLLTFLTEKRDVKPRLLLHACCAPCATSVVEMLQMGFDVTIFFYNPNIHPEAEYQKRLNEFAKLGDVKIIAPPFNPSSFYQVTKGLENEPEGKIRCYACYQERMEVTAQYAKLHQFDFFTTTLSVSPYKNSDYVNEIGQKLEAKHQMPFVYSNFKKQNGYLRSIELSKQLDIYRQNYCGCIYSLQNREKK